METLHAGLARSAVFYSLILGVWAFWRFFRRSDPSPSFSGAVAIAALLYLVQALVGLLLVLSGGYDDLARPAVHILYGMAAVLVIPGVYIYTRGEQNRRVMAIYGVAFLFLTAMLYFRAIGTGYEKSAPEPGAALPAVELRLA